MLLQFNQSDNAPITYTTIAENTGIEEKELKRTLLSLAAGKGQRVLKKNPGVSKLFSIGIFLYFPLQLAYLSLLI